MTYLQAAEKIRSYQCEHIYDCETKYPDCKGKAFNKVNPCEYAAALDALNAMAEREDDRK